LSEFLDFFIRTLTIILNVALIGRVLMSWINVGPTSPIYPVTTILYQVTEPVLAPIRRILPKFGTMDFSPMVALLIINLVSSMITP
jgi:YggT family protein